MGRFLLYVHYAESLWLTHQHVPTYQCVHKWLTLIQHPHMTNWRASAANEPYTNHVNADLRCLNSVLSGLCPEASRPYVSPPKDDGRLSSYACISYLCSYSNFLMHRLPSWKIENCRKRKKELRAETNVLSDGEDRHILPSLAAQNLESIKRARVDKEMRKTS